MSGDPQIRVGIGARVFAAWKRCRYDADGNIAGVVALRRAGMSY